MGCITMAYDIVSHQGSSTGDCLIFPEFYLETPDYESGIPTVHLGTFQKVQFAADCGHLLAVHVLV